jgi:hypothetical protein
MLLREAFEIAVVGDAEPIPLVERPEWAEMHAGTRHHDMTLGLEIALGKPVADPMRNVAIALLSPESYLTLTDGRGFTRAEYEAAMARALVKIAG